jgi:hypothetical protein
LWARQADGFSFDFGHIVEEVRELTADEELFAQRAVEREDRRPKVLVSGRYQRNIASDCLALLEAANEISPRFFRFGDALVQLIRDVDGTPSIRTLTKTALSGVLEREGNFVKASGDGIEPARLPLPVVADILETTDLCLPALHGITQTPVFSAGGLLATTKGYDAETGLFIDLADGFAIPDVSLSPFAHEIMHARSLIVDELLGDFPFTSDADRAHAVALLLSRPTRRLVDGPTPLFLVESPTPGTGKGLLVDVLTSPILGHGPATMTEGRNEDEYRKRITAKLIGAPEFVVIDNVASELTSSALSSALTSSSWEDRVLGYSRMVTLPVNCTWIATANNPSLSLEVSRRTISVRIDSGLERPWRRGPREFRHPGLRVWAAQNRADLIWAILTLIQAWLSQGRPTGSKTLGSYESWAEVNGGILDVAGIPGFLENADRVYAVADREIAAWEEFCAAWWEDSQDRPVGVDQLFGLATRERLLLDIWSGKNNHSGRTRFGIALKRMRDRIVGDYRILGAEVDPHTKTARHRLEDLRGVRGVAGGLSDLDSETNEHSKVDFGQQPNLANVSVKSESGPENVPQPPATLRKDPWDSFMSGESDELS